MLERRIKYRANVALPGVAAFAKAAADVPCVVLNLSSRGACVAFAPDTEMPRVFELRVGKDPNSQTVRIVWRRTNTVGVAFLAPRVVPDVLPG
ncbi:PilZ domain-containing protein [Methylobacterium sp. E-065]|uniref:PilZ domain-containing protein n=1 Tax=Methylobacterium sp. E-065 TaxID=2836583 RepID=UPI001FB95307|nr:PilZ domain-containing protein [Methylobacterium sp. E-065]MCJ2016948.1 PilZ domain-containing protein [Methylobacterium sp. E-065]